ncbi:hypothetical protein ERE07_03240 [Allopusillimonas ginsengisoli]|nr:hypothetical protein ERE07_03240 [Allopusillimonas ginsengisoli]
MHSIAELPTYIKLADKLLGENERRNLIDFLAQHPKAGDIIEGTGGIRKSRRLSPTRWPLWSTYS